MFSPITPGDFLLNRSFPIKADNGNAFAFLGSQKLKQDANKPWFANQNVKYGKRGMIDYSVTYLNTAL